MAANFGEVLHAKLNKFHRNGHIPYYLRGPLIQKRWQWKKHPSGVYYHIPESAGLGRYNDPTGKKGICYTADTAVVAIAESLGRVYQLKGESFTLGLDDLKVAQIYTLETIRGTKTINMPRLQGMLHLTSDKTMGADYRITQAITEWAVNTPESNFDGISYPSRHYNSSGLCTAFWEREGEMGPLIDVTHCSVDKYLDEDKENFPQNWSEKDISGLEIVAVTLNFNVNEE